MTHYRKKRLVAGDEAIAEREAKPCAAGGADGPEPEPECGCGKADVLRSELRMD